MGDQAWGGDDRGPRFVDPEKPTQEELVVAEGGEVSDTVTPETMQRVEIGRGWLIEQFVKKIIGNKDIERAYIERAEYGSTWVVAVHKDAEDMMFGSAYYDLNPNFAKALDDLDALLAQKNLQYGGSWQVDFLVTSLCDLRDKLYRLDSASRSGAVLKWDPDKFTGTHFDILARVLMILALHGANFKDDDDDR